MWKCQYLKCEPWPLHVGENAASSAYQLRAPMTLSYGAGPDIISARFKWYCQSILCWVSCCNSVVCEPIFIKLALLNSQENFQKAEFISRTNFVTQPSGFIVSRNALFRFKTILRDFLEQIRIRETPTVSSFLVGLWRFWYVCN